jgi:hypothetical protein
VKDDHFIFRSFFRLTVEVSQISEAQTISTNWHAYWRQPVKFAEPKKPWGGYTVMNFLSNTLIVSFDENTQSLLISHPDTTNFPQPFVTIRQETYSAMKFDEASEFLGARLILLIPAIREHFKEEIDALSKSEFGKSKRGSATDHQ